MSEQVTPPTMEELVTKVRDLRANKQRVCLTWRRRLSADIDARIREIEAQIIAIMQAARRGRVCGPTLEP